MKIILDTDKNQIIIPWDHEKKLEKINEIVMEATKDESRKVTFPQYIDNVWKQCMAHPDECIIAAPMPKTRAAKK